MAGWLLHMAASVWAGVWWSVYLPCVGDFPMASTGKQSDHTMGGESIKPRTPLMLLISPHQCMVELCLTSMVLSPGGWPNVAHLAMDPPNSV